MERDFDMYIYHILDKIENGMEYKKGGLTAERLTLEDLKVSLNGDGVLDLAGTVRLYDFLKGHIQYSIQVIEYFKKYSPDSPKYWKEVDKVDPYDDDDEQQGDRYQLYINLEEFIKSESSKSDKYKDLDFYIPDNYELANRIIKEYEALGNDVSKIGDNSYREVACFESSDKSVLEKLAEYIDEIYVRPKTASLMESMKIESVYFTETQMDFNYVK